MKNEKVIYEEVTELLHILGLPAHIKGYDYLRTAIIMTYFNGDYLSCIVKGLYADVAAKYNTTISSVEQGIRGAIEAGWKRAGTAAIESVFYNTVLYNKSRPTNAEFIAMIVDKLKVKYFED